MTVATYITVARILMVPVFAVQAVAYGVSVAAGQPDEVHRWLSLMWFVLAAGTDGLDGWVARRFHQQSELGAFLDPIADKFLLLTGVLTLASVDWGESGWRLPIWFAAIVFLRDAFILIGMGWLYTKGLKIHIQPHWIGKWCTASQMVALGWVMLHFIPLSPVLPCVVAAVFTAISTILYLRQGLSLLQANR